MLKGQKNLFPPSRLKLQEGLILVLILLGFIYLARPQAPAKSIRYQIFSHNQLIKEFAADNLNYGWFSLEDLPGVVFDFNAQGLAIIKNDCPDGYCLHQGRISEVGQQIICLPKLLIVKVVEDHPDYDFITPAY